MPIQLLVQVPVRVVAVVVKHKTHPIVVVPMGPVLPLVQVLPPVPVPVRVPVLVVVQVVVQVS